jgi:phosphate transport system substrate-binding protein
MGYFGYAYYVANADALKVLQIDGGSGCVEPNPETIESYTYKPLARPIFIYPSTESLARPEVMEFVKYYLSPRTHELIVDVGYIVAPEKTYTDGLAAIDTP